MSSHALIPEILVTTLSTSRPPSSSFDSVMRSRYFPGGPTPDGLESDIIFKSLAGEEMRERARRESEGEMMTDNR